MLRKGLEFITLLHETAEVIIIKQEVETDELSEHDMMHKVH
jgi:hypothetical protein